MSTPTIPTPEQLAALPPEYLAQYDGRSMLDTAISLIVIETVVFSLFLISRVRYAERNTWDTWTLYPLAYVCLIGLDTAGICNVLMGGGGRHTAYWLIHDPNTIKKALQIQTAGEFLYVISATIPKIPILLLYIRVFTDRITRLLSWVAMGLTVGNWLGTGVFAYFLICQPFAFKWDKTIPGGHCADLMAGYKYVSIPNIVSDLMIVILPLPSLIRLQTSKARKLGIVLTFLAGGMGIIASLIRFVNFYKTDILADFTYNSKSTWIYTMVEPGTYFLCSCFLGIRPLLNAVYENTGFKTLISTYTSGKRPSEANDHQLNTFGGTGSRHFASASAVKSPYPITGDDDEDGLIHLEHSVVVESRTAVSENSSTV